jgi:hypothetical protein
MVGEYMVAQDADEEIRQGFIYTHKDFSISYNGMTHSLVQSMTSISNGSKANVIWSY